MDCGASILKAEENEPKTVCTAPGRRLLRLHFSELFPGPERRTKGRRQGQSASRRRVRHLLRGLPGVHRQTRPKKEVRNRTATGTTIRTGGGAGGRSAPELDGRPSLRRMPQRRRASPPLLSLRDPPMRGARSERFPLHELRRLALRPRHEADQHGPLFSPSRIPAKPRQNARDGRRDMGSMRSGAMAVPPVRPAVELV